MIPFPTSETHTTAGPRRSETGGGFERGVMSTTLLAALGRLVASDHLVAPSRDDGRLAPVLSTDPLHSIESGERAR
ncbi:MAG: hypothetical protein V2I67_01245 [Thermoanaerobaculales bacterium]|jgi:hypothetical protein|nr:hypothetical protein [Thermoanaerobaculales bacterium]